MLIVVVHFDPLTFHHWLEADKLLLLAGRNFWKGRTKLVDGGHWFGFLVISAVFRPKVVPWTARVGPDHLIGFGSLPPAVTNQADKQAPDNLYPTWSIEKANQKMTEKSIKRYKSGVIEVESQ